MMKKNRERFIVDFHGYGTMNPKSGGHMMISPNKNVCTTLTTQCSFNKYVIEIYKDDENSDSESLW